IESHRYQDATNALTAIKGYQWSFGGVTDIREALYNASSGIREPFLGETSE
ncbi:hypothetical protein LXA43DRAFT_885076, partial [Ganoderma leucocontextum]